jgi:hypothetical protein
VHRHGKLIQMSCELLFLSALIPSVGLADSGNCPPAQLSVRQDDLHYHYGGEFAVLATAYDSSFSVGTGFARLRFDHDRSTLASSVASDGWFTASVRVVERFDVTGVPSGTPVSASFVFTVDGWAQNCGLSGCGVSYWASLVTGTDSVIANASQNGPGNVRSYLTGSLSLPITITAGTPVEATFAINYHTPRFAEHIQAEGSGTYSVSGLPSGVRAVSCFAAAATPVHARSWGSIKRIYR